MKELIEAIAKLPWVLWCPVIIAFLETIKVVFMYLNTHLTYKQLKLKNKKATKSSYHKK